MGMDVPLADVEKNIRLESRRRPSNRATEKRRVRYMKGRSQQQVAAQGRDERRS